MSAMLVSPNVPEGEAEHETCNPQWRCVVLQVSPDVLDQRYHCAATASETIITIGDLGGFGGTSDIASR